MLTFKYKFQHQSNLIRLGNMLDDMWQVHDYFHRWQNSNYENEVPYQNWNAMNAHVTELKETTHKHWNSLPSQSIQLELKRIDIAYQNFLDWCKNRTGRKIGKPRRKPQHKFKSMTLTQTGWKIEDNRIRITFRRYCNVTDVWKFDYVWFTFFKHRDWIGNIAIITIKRDNCGDYWLCITTDASASEPMGWTGEIVGADFGMKDAFLTLDTGEKIQSPQFLKRDINKLRSLSKALSRKEYKSGNWYRALRALQRFYRSLQNKRHDWQWKLAHDLCERFEIICIEDLNIAAMKKLWGRKVSDLSFSAFVIKLAHKCRKHGRWLRFAGRWEPTTKPCSECGYKNETLTLADRSWICPECNTQHDRDINAAKNILQVCLDT